MTTRCLIPCLGGVGRRAEGIEGAEGFLLGRLSLLWEFISRDGIIWNDYA